MADKGLAIAEPEQGKQLAFVPNKENVDLLKKTLGSQNINLTDAELSLTIYQATKTGLDPLSKQIYPMKDKSGRMSFITAIDGYRLIAERTGKYRGQLGPFWCGPDGVWKEVWLGNGQPSAAKVGVLHENFKEPLWAVARWSSYARTTGQWPTMGDIMIAKCAEALALRKAFPQELSNLYTSEEMEQADPSQSEPAAAAKQPKGPSTKELMAEIGKELEAKGFADSGDRRQIIKSLAGVNDIRELTNGQLPDLLEAVKGTSAEEMKKLLPIDGEISQPEEKVEDAS